MINITKGNCDVCLEEMSLFKRNHKNEVYCYLIFGKKEVGLCKEHFINFSETFQKFNDTNKADFNKI